MTHTDETTTARVFRRPAELSSAVGEHLGVSSWRTMTQEMVDAFAETTDDQQWIHVDRARAAAGPFGTTVAHGFLTLSLLPSLLREIYEVHGYRMGINYGLDRVRFLSPVPVGSRVRGSADVLDVVAEEQRVRLTLRVTVQSEGNDKPACVADFVVLMVM